MLKLLQSDTSPYVALWYLFLVFFAVVVVFQGLCLLAKRYYTWRIRKLTEQHSGDSA